MKFYKENLIIECKGMYMELITGTEQTYKYTHKMH